MTPHPPDPGRPYAGESPAERTARRRQQFLDAGLELMGTVGYRATTVRALCREAKLTDRYFYASFAGTEPLLAEVYRVCIGRLQAQVLGALAATPPGADTTGRIDAMLEAFFQAVEDARLARVVWLEVLGVSPAIDRLYRDALDSFAKLVLGFVTTAHPHWVVDPEESHVLSLAAVGAISQSAMCWLLSGYQARRDTLVRAHGLLIRGLLAEVGKGMPPADASVPGV